MTDPNANQFTHRIRTRIQKQPKFLRGRGGICSSCQYQPVLLYSTFWTQEIPLRGSSRTYCRTDSCRWKGLLPQGADPSPPSYTRGKAVYSAVANIVEGSLHCCQYRGVFIVPLPTENNNILGLKYSLRHCIQRPNLIIAPLSTDVMNNNKRPLTDLVNSRTRWRCNFKRLSQHEGQADFSKKNGLSNEPNFGQIRLAGQYLQGE